MAKRLVIKSSSNAQFGNGVKQLSVDLSYVALPAAAFMAIETTTGSYAIWLTPDETRQVIKRLKKTLKGK